ncbi:hypothetical protein PsorP6_014966 [Peronosclerospora sorghi]|uniref:Uncharacterized protein n=1 Tax=Peronosclerospora sorghi TaxID=230839 RepID=A0ACC0VSU9_9STRA|nr:hypothetical protein PsorP6_014966 [Peronosclerospora sorghi]
MAAGRTTIDPRDTVLIFQEVFTLEQATRRKTLEESNLREILPLYKFNHKTKSRSESLHKDDEALASRSEDLAQARRLANELNRKSLPTQVGAPSSSQMLDEAADEALRWFVYPSEVAEAIKRETNLSYWILFVAPFILNDTITLRAGFKISGRMH